MSAEQVRALRQIVHPLCHRRGALDLFLAPRHPVWMQDLGHCDHQVHCPGRLDPVQLRLVLDSPRSVRAGRGLLRQRLNQPPVGAPSAGLQEVEERGQLARHLQQGGPAGLR